MFLTPQRFFTTLLSCFVFLQGWSQLTGTITGGPKKEPLPGAIVTWQGTRIGAATDSVGNFRIAWPDTFPHTLLIRSTGFRSQEINFRSKEVASIRVNLSSDTLITVVITGKRDA